MFAVVGRVKIKPGHEQETRAMIAKGGVAMVQGMRGSVGGWWARTLDGELIQHSLWLFDTEENARSAEATFSHSVRCPTLPPRSSASTPARSWVRRDPDETEDRAAGRRVTAPPRRSEAAARRRTTRSRVIASRHMPTVAGRALFTPASNAIAVVRVATARAPAGRPSRHGERPRCRCRFASMRTAAGGPRCNDSGPGLSRGRKTVWC
jgi:hypothetical protein